MAAFAVQAAVVYKWVDADGVVHYSDQASPGAEKIFTSSSTSAAATSGSRPPPGSRQAPATAGPATTGLGYSEFTITSPVSDQAFFGDDVIAVHLSLAPTLKPNQGITWHLNGKQLDFPPDAVSFPLPHLDRGTYALAATITDQRTGESQSSNTVTFFVRQPSALSPLSPQHK
ncbi:MAG: DUF4124 domain-containing protein [Pseudomonadota bacterium]|nr:DUF4124 domain-containing protein [Pseudomonadota bacterium]